MRKRTRLWLWVRGFGWWICISRCLSIADMHCHVLSSAMNEHEKHELAPEGWEPQRAEKRKESKENRWRAPWHINFGFDKNYAAAFVRSGICYNVNSIFIAPTTRMRTRKKMSQGRRLASPSVACSNWCLNIVWNHFILTPSQFPVRSHPCSLSSFFPFFAPVVAHRDSVSINTQHADT